MKDEGRETRQKLENKFHDALTDASLALHALEEDDFDLDAEQVVLWFYITLYLKRNKN